MVTTFQIYFGENTRTMKFIQHIIKSRETTYFGENSHMYKFIHVVVALKLYNILNVLIQALKKSSHCSLITLFNVCSYQRNLHLLVIIMNTFTSLIEPLQFVMHFPYILRWDKYIPHDSLHYHPSVHSRSSQSFSIHLDLIPPHQCISFKF